MSMFTAVASVWGLDGREIEREVTYVSGLEICSRDGEIWFMRPVIM